MLSIDQRYIYMQRNLQYGEIIAVGKSVSKHSPEIVPGHIALFHHSVEHNNMYLAGTDNNGDEYRIVSSIPHVQDPFMTNMLYGVITPAGEIIPFDDYLFCDINVIPLTNSQRKTSAFKIYHEHNEAQYAKEENIELTQWRKQFETTILSLPDLASKEKLLRELNNIYAQQDTLARMVNKIRFAKVFALFSSMSAKKMGITNQSLLLIQPDILYPLTIETKSFFLVRHKNIDGFYTK